jgi:hypothetical protein
MASTSVRLIRRSPVVIPSRDLSEAKGTCRGIFAPSLAPGTYLQRSPGECVSREAEWSKAEFVWTPCENREGQAGVTMSPQATREAPTGYRKLATDSPDTLSIGVVFVNFLVRSSLPPPASPRTLSGGCGNLTGLNHEPSPNFDVAIPADPHR